MPCVQWEVGRVGDGMRRQKFSINETNRVLELRYESLYVYRL